MNNFWCGTTFPFLLEQLFFVDLLRLLVVAGRRKTDEDLELSVHSPLL